MTEYLVDIYVAMIAIVLIVLWIHALLAVINVHRILTHTFEWV